MPEKRPASEASTASYIVRVYRVEQKRRGGIVGIVETVGADVKTAFTNVDELWNIFSAEKTTPVTRPIDGQLPL